MILFLIQFYYDDTIIAYYDGNHITTDPDREEPIIKVWPPLHQWSYSDITESFIDLNDEEKQLLKKYYELVLKYKQVPIR